MTKPRRWSDGPKLRYKITISPNVKIEGKWYWFSPLGFTVGGEYPLIDVVRTIFRAFRARLPVNLEAKVKALSDDIQAHNPRAKKWQKLNETLGPTIPVASKVGNILREAKDKDRKALPRTVPGSEDGPVHRAIRRLDETYVRRQRPADSSDRS